MFFFEKVLLHRNSDIFSFSATRNQCNGETEMFCFEKVYFIGNLKSSISLQQEISAIVKQKCFALKKFYFIGTLISSISLQQEISAMVKQKCFALKKVLLHRNSDIFYFSAARNQCNGETKMSLFYLFFCTLIPSISNRCNGEAEMFCFE